MLAVAVKVSADLILLPVLILLHGVSRRQGSLSGSRKGRTGKEKKGEKGMKHFHTGKVARAALKSYRLNWAARY